MQTVVGLYRSIEEANQVRQALLNEGYSGGDVTVIDQSESGYGEGGYGSTGYGTGTNTGSGVTGLTGSNAALTDTNTSQYGGTSTATDTNETGVGAKIKHFFQGLAGHDEHTHTAYTEGINRGGALVAVRVNDNETERAAGVLRSYGATDVEDGGADVDTGRNVDTLRTGAGYENTREGYNATGAGTTTGFGAGTGAVAGEQVIPVVEEELVVGKRQVERGGVRVYSHVVSEPVSESVSLHDERVVVDRHAVNRPATEADFTDAGPIEVRATGEEAVVGKTGRVVEEVVVGKTATDRTETVQDSVRHTEVDVEPVNTGNVNATTTGVTGSDPTTSSKF
jgi:uncharacterized protein (TIGR02271 family)